MQNGKLMVCANYAINPLPSAILMENPILKPITLNGSRTMGKISLKIPLPSARIAIVKCMFWICQQMRLLSRRNLPQGSDTLGLLLPHLDIAPLQVSCYFRISPILLTYRRIHWKTLRTVHVDRMKLPCWRQKRHLSCGWVYYKFQP